MLDTLQDAIAYMRPFVKNGTCNTSTITSRINECTRRLIRKGNLVDTTRWMKIVVTGNTFALPREAESVLHVNIDQSPSKVMGQAYEFLSHGPGEVVAGEGFTNKFLIDMGDGFPTFFDIPDLVHGDSPAKNTSAPQKIVAFSTDESDASLSMTIKGVDEYAQPFMTGATPGVSLSISRWKDGTEGSVDTSALTSGLSYSAEPFADITSVHKPVTKGHVSLYTYDPSDHRMYFLSKYHPDEVTPGYRRYKLTAASYTDGTAVLCLVKLRYVPAKHDLDVLLVQNLDALKLMSLAIERENDREIQEAAAYEQQAERLLDEQVRNNRTDWNNLQIENQWHLGGINLR